METNVRSYRYCMHCGAKNDVRRKKCIACGKDLDPKENQLKDYLKKEAKDQLKDNISDTLFGKLRKFLLAHLYGIALTVSVVFTAVSAVTAFGASSVPKEAVLLKEPPVANALGYLSSEFEEGSDEAFDAEDTAEPEDSAEVKSTPEPETVTEPKSAFEDALAAPEETVEPEETPGVLEAQLMFAAYKELLSKAQGEIPGYYIYDIDKDGIPELLLTAEDGPNRGLNVYSYANGNTYSAGILWGFSNGNPIPASYPDGNGIVLTEIARDYECIWVLSKNGTSMSGDVRTSSNSVYEEPLYDLVSTYYQNAEDGLFVSAGHPYRSETAAPYFEGSQLLGFNSVSDDSALKEALGL